MSSLCVNFACGFVQRCWCLNEVNVDNGWNSVNAEINNLAEVAVLGVAALDLGWTVSLATIPQGTVPQINGWTVHLVFLDFGWMAHALQLCGWMDHDLQVPGWTVHNLQVPGWMDHDLQVPGWMDHHNPEVLGWTDRDLQVSGWMNHDL